MPANEPALPYGLRTGLNISRKSKVEPCSNMTGMTSRSGRAAKAGKASAPKVPQIFELK